MAPYKRHALLRARHPHEYMYMCTYKMLMTSSAMNEDAFEQLNGFSLKIFSALVWVSILPRAAFCNCSRP